MSSAEAVKKTVVTRERVVAPADRFVSVTDGILLKYFAETVSITDKPSLSKLHEMFEGLCQNNFSKFRRTLEADFAFFADAASAVVSTDPREREPTKYEAELDAQEARFLSKFIELLEASHYKLLTAPEWDAALAEEFLLTLPVTVNYNYMENTVLPRALWSTRPALQAEMPADVADRMLIFHRGVDTARMQGLYILRKIDLILSFFVLQPLFKIFAFIMSLFGVKKYLPEAPTYMAPVEEAAAAVTDQSAADEAKSVATAIKTGKIHEASVNIERRTFDRVFPNGPSVFKQLFKRIELKEACFKDVIVLYRKAVPDEATPPGEFDIIHQADPAFLKRNFIIKRFGSIPIADLELVFPEKNLYMPPQVMTQMIITVVTVLITIITTIQGGVSLKAAWPLLTIIGSRAYQLYTTTNIQKTTIQRNMQTLIYDRLVASQEPVLASLVDEMARQRTRELLIAYCILLSAGKSLTPDELDARCETFLNTEFGLSVDFTTEDALPTLIEWGLAVPADAAPGGAVSALPLAAALPKLDTVWDNLFNFSLTDGLNAEPSSLLGRVLSTAMTASAVIPPETPTGSGISGSGAVGSESKKKGLFSRFKAAS